MKTSARMHVEGIIDWLKIALQEKKSVPENHHSL